MTRLVAHWPEILLTVFLVSLGMAWYELLMRWARRGEEPEYEAAPEPDRRWLEYATAPDRAAYDLEYQAQLARALPPFDVERDPWHATLDEDDLAVMAEDRDG